MSGTVQIESFNAGFLTREKLHDLIFYRKSFDITNVTDISETVKRVEYAIEHQQKKLTCRVYTEYRSTAVAGSLWQTLRSDHRVKSRTGYFTKTLAYCNITLLRMIFWL